MNATPHKERMRQAFTAQADSYASSAVIAAEESRRGFVEFVAPEAAARVLDVATGPGFLALLFAERARIVVGIDLTPAMLTRAEANRIQRGCTNVSFREGDAEALSFPDASFDIATCGSAFHHFRDPRRVLSEMVRVTRAGGVVALIDITTAENPDQALVHNRLENWRDPSHVRCLPLSELVAMCRQAGLQDIRTSTYGTPRELEEWFAISKTPPEVAERVRAAFIASIPNDSTGLAVRLEGERVCFTHTFAWVVGVR